MEILVKITKSDGNWDAHIATKILYENGFVYVFTVKGNFAYKLDDCISVEVTER